MYPEPALNEVERDGPPGRDPIAETLWITKSLPKP
jgi:hypothetical protein